MAFVGKVYSRYTHKPAHVVYPGGGNVMLQEIFGVVRHALMISSFVFVMMLVIEYLNVLTQGS